MLNPGVDHILMIELIRRIYPAQYNTQIQDSTVSKTRKELATLKQGLTAKMGHAKRSHQAIAQALASSESDSAVKCLCAMYDLL